MNDMALHLMKTFKKYNLKLLVVVPLLMVSHSGFSQDPEALKKIESARIALITERLELTPEQAEKFWPIYREYTSKRELLRREFLDAKRVVGEGELTEEQSKSLLDKGLELKEKQLDLDKNYTERFNRVITTRQLLQLRKAEDEFRQMLLQRIERRRDQRDRMNRREDLRKNN